MNRIPQAEICEDASDESLVFWDEDAIQAVIRATDGRYVPPSCSTSLRRFVSTARTPRQCESRSVRNSITAYSEGFSDIGRVF